MQCKVKRGSDGVWYARPYLGRTVEGKVIQPYRQFPTAKTEAEAQELANAWASNLTADGKVKSALLVNLLEDYTEHKRLNGASPNTIRSYRLFTRYCGKYLTSANACDLTVIDMTRFEQRLLVPKADGGQGLCRNSVRNVHDFLRGAWNWFASIGVCDFNPLNNVDKPKLERHEATALNIGDFSKLDEELKPLLKPSVLNNQSYRRVVNAFAAWLALRTGVRVGEVCAIRICDISKSRKHIHVCGTVVEEPKKKPYRKEETKGKKSRNVDISESDIAEIEAFMRLRLEICGDLPADAPLITVEGSFMRPSTISRAFGRIVKQTNMPKGFVFHDLRHTHFTWLLMHGIDLKTVATRAGHADEATTLRIYAHVLPGRGEQAAIVFEQAAKEAIEKTSLGELLQ